MTVDSPSNNPSTSTESYDICIIGAGAAGLVLAEIFSTQSKLKVCILENGPDHFKDRKEPYHVESKGKFHAGVNDGRITAFGGATNTWGGGLIRNSHADFDPLDGRSDTRWPMSFESMIPHYEAIENIFDFRAAPEGPQNIIIDEGDLVVRRREIPVLPFRSKNFAHRFGPGLRARPSVTIHCNADIKHIHSAPSRHITALDVTIAGSAPRTITAKHFIISAGLVNSNLIAQRFFSACGMASFADRTGTYFHDHVSFPIARMHPKKQGPFSRKFGYRFERGLMIGEHFDIESKSQRIPGGFLHLAFDMSESTILRPVRDVLNLIQRRNFSEYRLPSLREIAALAIGLPRLGITRYIFGRLYLDRGTKVLATLDLEQIPQPNWKIQGDASQSTCQVDWDLSQDDARYAAQYVPICHQIMQRLRKESDFDIEPMIPDPVKEFDAFAAHIRKVSVDTLHNSGGLRMGTRPDDLVDADLRLQGIPNTYVVSSAVFPRVGTSNPTLTILALGHRLATRLMRELN